MMIEVVADDFNFRSARDIETLNRRKNSVENRKAARQQGDLSFKGE